MQILSRYSYDIGVSQETFTTYLDSLNKEVKKIYGISTEEDDQGAEIQSVESE